jgi:predicted phage tail protein
MVKASTQRQLTTIHLGGALGKRFGEIWRLRVSSPAEALRAIDTNTRGAFLAYLGGAGKAKYYKVALGRKDQLLGAEEVGHRSGTVDIYVWPTIKARNSGVGKIIAGIALLALVIWNPAGLFYVAANATTAGGLTVLGDVTVAVGTSLLLGGISQLLAPHPNQNQGELNSNNFQGTIAAGQQGGSVPVVYGKALVSPIPVSIWFNAVDWNTTANAYVGTLQITDLPGGGTEYVQVPTVTPTVNAAGGGS